MRQNQFWKSPFLIPSLGFIIFLGFNVFGVSRLILDINKYSAKSSIVNADMTYSIFMLLPLMACIFSMLVAFFFKRRKD